MADARAQFAVVKALSRDLSRHVAPSMFTSGFSRIYDKLKMAILKGGDLTDRPGLNQLFHNTLSSDC